MFPSVSHILSKFENKIIRIIKKMVMCLKKISEFFQWQYFNDFSQLEAYVSRASKIQFILSRIFVFYFDTLYK